jgi:uncharacterized protein (TIGR03437 family)
VSSFISLQAQVNILTANGDIGRTNSNLQESQLSSATVNSTSFGKLGVISVDGQVYAQPLYVSGLSVGGKTRNVLFVSTMHNSVYAFDADAVSPAAPLWQVHLGPSVSASFLFGQYGDISNEVGILSTGTIDLQRGVIYVVADVLQSGKPVFYLHALDLATGNERLNGPVAMTATVPGIGSGSLTDGTLPFDPMQHIQRPGLLLSGGTVSVGFGSHGDQSPFHGWILSYDASDLSRQVGIHMSTPDGDGGSFWHSGRGLAADAQGNIYAITGNGDYDGIRNFGESFVKMSALGFDPPFDWFTPSDWKSLSDNDFDISAGPALIPGTHTVVGADKGGTMYVLNGDAMRPMENASIIQASAGSIFSLAVWNVGGVANVYLQGQREPLKCFQVTGGTVNPVPTSMGGFAVPYGRIGMTLSANGSQGTSGILWESTGDYNQNTPGTLHAYDASNLANELWNSDMNSDRDQMPPVTKFVAPTVANGKVYVPGLTNVIAVYGLLTVDPGQGAPSPSISVVANAASYSQDAVSPGQLVAIFGSNLGPAVPAGLQLNESGNVATAIADTQVLFDGIASPLIFASAGQVNAVAPFGIGGDSTQVQVQYQGQTSDPVPMSVATATPAIFSADGSGLGQAAILNQDGTLNSPDNPAPAGSVVTLWATGAGQLSPDGIDGAVVSADNLPKPILPVTAQIGGQAATVLYAGGSPGIVEGVIQVNLRVPRNSTPGAAIPLVLSIGGGASQTGLTLAIGPALQ